MKLAALSTILLSANAFSAVCAAPQFVSQYEDDGKTLTQSRKGNSIYDRLREDKRFSRFVEVLEKERGLKDDLESRDKETTVFAPTNEAFKHMEDQWKGRDEGSHPNIRDIIKYHIASEAEISKDCLHAGALIPTNLRLKSLDDRHQRIRVFKFGDAVFLNMHARIVDSDKADNGFVHAVDKILHPPKGVTEMLYAVPTSFSTTLAAFERTDLACDLNSKEKAITVFAPSNHAWEQLGFQNLKYLFSCVGQKEEEERGGSSRRRGEKGEQGRQPSCRGTEDLKRIMEFHVAKQLAYSTDIMKKETIKFKTLEGSQLTVCAKRRESGGGRSDKWDEDRDSKHQDVRRYNFVVNNGDARVQFTDALACNGAIQVIDNVLIPRDVTLPHDKWMM